MNRLWRKRDHLPFRPPGPDRPRRGEGAKGFPQPDEQGDRPKPYDQWHAPVRTRPAEADPVSGHKIQECARRGGQGVCRQPVMEKKLQD